MFGEAAADRRCRNRLFRPRGTENLKRAMGCQTIRANKRRHARSRAPQNGLLSTVSLSLKFVGRRHAAFRLPRICRREHGAVSSGWRANASAGRFGLAPDDLIVVGILGLAGVCRPQGRVPTPSRIDVNIRNFSSRPGLRPIVLAIIIVLSGGRGHYPCPEYPNTVRIPTRASLHGDRSSFPSHL